MRQIRISDEVWNAIAERGGFGETEDDVLRRVFDLPAADASVHSSPRRPQRRRTFATRRMHTPRVDDGQLVVEFQDGKPWNGPSQRARPIRGRRTPSSRPSLMLATT